MMGKLGTGNIEIGNNSTLATPAGAAALVAAVWRAAIFCMHFVTNCLQFTGFRKSGGNDNILGSGQIGKE